MAIISLDTFLKKKQNSFIGPVKPTPITPRGPAAFVGPVKPTQVEKKSTLSKIGQKVVTAAKAPFKKENLDTLLKPTKKVLNFGKDVVQGTARSGAAVALTAMGKDNVQVPSVLKPLYGDKPLRDFGGVGQETLKSFGANKLSANKPTAFAVGGALSLLDFTGAGKADDVFKGIAKSKDATKILKQLTKLGVKDDTAKILAKQLTKVDDAARVKTIVSNFIAKPTAVNVAKVAEPGTAIPKALGQGETFTKAPIERAGFKSQPILETVKSGGNDLATEARKYKSAEEFVKAQPKLYHGGTADIAEVKLGKGRFDKTFYLSENADYAKSYGGSRSTLNEMVIDPTAKLADMRKPTPDLIAKIEKAISGERTGKTIKIQKPDGTYVNIPEIKGANSNAVYSNSAIIQGLKDGKAMYAELPEVKAVLRKLGYDGQITAESKFGSNYGVWNKDVIRTKSQLTDIYNKASQTRLGGGLDFNSQAGFAKVPDAMQPAEYAKEVVKPDKIFKTNIRVDKFQTSAEGQNNLARIIEENKGFGAERRGVMSFADTEKLAQEIIPKTRLKAGKSLNAEELQSLGNTVAGLQNKVDDFTKQIAGGKNSDDVLLGLAQAKEELTFALASFSGASAETGRSLSILRNIRKATESGDSKLIQDAIKISGGRQSAEDIARKLVELGDDNIGKLKFLRDIAKVKTTDKIYEVWLNSILSNPLTQAVNVTGNVINAIMKVPTRIVQAGLQVPGKRKVFIGEVPNQVVGALEGITTGVRKALYVMKNGISPTQASKLDVQHLPAIKGVTGEVIRTPTKLLGAADEFFKAIVHTSEMRSLSYRQARQEGLKGAKAYERMHELISNPTKELYEAVDVSKLKATFQEPLGKFGTSLMNFRNSAPGVKYVIPFIKTPTNIAKQALKTSPVGFLNVAKKLGKGEYKNAGLTQELTEDLAQATIGSMIAIPVVMGALNDDITGSAPTNQAEKDAFYRSGKQPYSIRVGDKWYSYRRIEPIGTVIGTIADFTKVNKEEGMEQAALDIASIIGRNLNDKTFLSGISNFIDALTDDEKRGQWVSNTLSGAVPFSGTQRFITRIADPVNRKPDGVVDTIKAQTPGLSTQVTPRLDAFGEDSERTKSQALSPIGVTQEKTDPVESELTRLKIYPGFPSKTIAGQELSTEEYTKYQRVSGRIIKDTLDSLVSDPVWNGLSDRQREQAIEKVISKVRAKVGSNLFPEKIKASDIKKRLLEKGMTSEQAEKMTAEIVAGLE